jgi:hypothetical protein
MIVPNCRQRITSHDLAFALDVLPQKARPADEGRTLLPDDFDLDGLLESRALLEALLRTRTLLSVSPYFFYYVLVRQVFVERGISERTVADYVSALLVHFLEGERLRENVETAPRSFVYLVDLIEAVRRARDHRAAFAMEARIGDVALFLTGVFPDAIYHRQTYGRRLPGLEYYEAVGRSGYHSAAQHPPPRHADLAGVLAFMASEFRIVRKALNDLSDTYFCLRRGGGESVDQLLRQALYGGDAERGEGPPREGWTDA